MLKFMKNRILSLYGNKLKDRLKLLLAAGVIIAVSVAVFYMYTNHVNKLGYEKYLLARNFYLQALNQENEHSIENFERAAQLFDELNHTRLWSGNKKEVLFYLADCLYQLGRLEESAYKLEEFRTRYSGSYFLPWVKLKLALTYEHMGNYQQAIDVYEPIATGYAQSAVAPEALLSLARCKELVNQKEAAIEVYENLILKYPLSNQAEIAQLKMQYLAQEKG